MTFLVLRSALHSRLALVCIAVGAAAGALSVSARAEELSFPKAKARTLDNGLRVIVVEDRDIPNCALYVHWNVGSRNERPGITGIAHMFEHMMFMGSEKYGARFDPIMEAVGGSNNAWTSRDQTVYTDWFPSSALSQILSMEADRMRGMIFDPAVVDSERGVVASERRLSMEEPVEQLREQVWAAAYVAHPYQWDVLGWPSDIAAWTKQDLETFFATYYTPQNALVVLVGDVDTKTALRLIESTMGTIPRGPVTSDPVTSDPVTSDPVTSDPVTSGPVTSGPVTPVVVTPVVVTPVVVTVEPEQKGERRVTHEAPAGTLPEVIALWHVPRSRHRDTPALEVLEHLLLSGESSRLHRLLVDEQELCLSVGGGLQGLQFDPSVFAVECTLRAGGETENVERLVYAELARIATDGPTDAELSAAIAKLRVRFLRRLRTIDGKAGLIGETAVFFGTWRMLRWRLEAIQNVSGDDVKRVAAHYFRKRNRTVGTLAIAIASASEDKAE